MQALTLFIYVWDSAQGSSGPSSFDLMDVREFVFVGRRMMLRLCSAKELVNPTVVAGNLENGTLGGVQRYPDRTSNPLSGMGVVRGRGVRLREFTPLLEV